MGLCRMLTVAALAGATAAGAGAVPSLAAEGRVYEMVSPPGKAGNAIDTRTTVQGTVDGNSVAYAAPGSFSGAQASVSSSFYLGRRSSDGWSVEPLVLPQANDGAQIGSPTLYLADDLSRAFQFSGRAFAPGATEGWSNLYVTDQAQQRTLVASAPGTPFRAAFVDIGAVPSLGASADLAHIAFDSPVSLLPDVPVGSSAVYEWADGRLRVASRLPDGSVHPDGASLAARAAPSRPVSSDGRRVLFTSPSGFFGGPLYVRTDGRQTRLISGSRRAGEDPTVPQDVYFQGASRDGKVVYFTSYVPLTDDATGEDVYRFDVETERLTNITAGSVVAPKAGALTVSDSGGTATFMTIVGLEPPGAGGAYFYAARHGVRRLIGELTSMGEGGRPDQYISPNGRYVGFVSRSPLTPDAGVDPGCSGAIGAGRPCTAVYVYDTDTGRLDCASCQPVDGRHADADFETPVLSISKHARRSVLDTGQVFFNTSAQLVRGDVNGRRDAYEWREGRLALISTGRSTDDSQFAEASADGRDVFFFTSERLVAQDVDKDTDLYDARIGGGIAAQSQVPASPPTCEGDGCQGSGASAPAQLTVAGSVDFSANEGSDDGRPGTSSLRAVVIRPRRGATAFGLRVRVSSRGSVKVSGLAIRPVSRSLSRAGQHTIKVPLARRAKRRLLENGELRVRLRVTFDPAAGASRTAVLTVALKA